MSDLPLPPSALLDIRECRNSRALAVAVAEELAEAIHAAVVDRGSASLALAGGTTPVPAYRELSAISPHVGRTRITPTDERWVSPRHQLSNAAMLARELPDAWSIAQLSDSERHADPGEDGALERAHQAVAALSSPLDAVLLGMGGDGHIASLFPDDPGIEAALTCEEPVASAHPPSQPTPRVTLTPGLLLDSRRLILAISGIEKRRTLQRALADGPVRDLPVRAILRAGKPVTVYYCP